MSETSTTAGVRGSPSGSSIPASEEELEAVLKTLGLRRKTIYETKNDEIIECDDLWPLVEQLISSGRIHPAFTLSFDYPGAKGRKSTAVYFLKSLVIFVESWHPYPGYSWSEMKVSLWVRP